MFNGHRLRVILASVVLSMLVAVSSAAADDVRNAADWYAQAIQRLGGVTEQQWNLLLDYNSAAEAPSPELRSTLRAMQPALALVRRGAAQQYSDYGLDFSEGFGLTLPHLGEMRNAARAMRAEALVKIHDGDVAGGARDLASIYRLGGHMADDRTLISSLVGQAIFSYADQSVAETIDRGLISAVAATELAHGVQQLDPHDPFGHIESIFSEQELITSSLKQILADDIEAQLSIESLTGNDGPEAEEFLNQLRMNGIDGEMARLDETMNAVVEIFLLDDEDEARRRLDEFDEKIESGEAGLFARFLMPAYDKVYEALLKSRAAVADRQVMLEKLAQGELDPKMLANAAIIYRQAIDAYNALPEQQRGQLEQAMSQMPDAFDERAVAALNEAAPIIELLREASMLRRCEFAPLRQDARSQLLPEYVLGMHRLLKLVEVDALRQLRSRHGEQAADRLAIGYAMVSHLGSDDVLLSPLVAHHSFQQYTALLRSGLQIGILAEHRTQLQNAVRRIVRRDPFGYINAVMQTRIELAKRLRRLTNADRGFDRKTVEQLVGKWPGDALLFVLTILETLENNERPPTAESDPVDDPIDNESLIHRMEHLGDIVSISVLRDIQAGIGDFAPQLALGNIDIVSGMQIPSIGNWSARMRRARADLRAVYKLLDVDEDSENEAVDRDDTDVNE